MSSEVSPISFLESLTEDQKIFLLGFVNLNRENIEVSWDMDQTLAITEIPVIAAIDNKFGTNYKSRRVDGWNSISDWLTSDGILNLDEARQVEHAFWVNNEILSQAEPNEPLRQLSFLAYQKGIKQSITTIRAPGLRQMTYKWVQKFFPWIPARNVNFRIGMQLPGHEFKISTILRQFELNPGLIHVDDDLSITKPLSQAAPNLGIIGLRYSSDNVIELNHSKNRVFLNRDELNSVIVAQYHIDK